MSADKLDGLVIITSDFGPKRTMDRLEAAVRASGAHVFARIDHAAGARAMNLVLEPMELLIFGSALAGTPLMQVAATIGIDLPLRALVWEDAANQTWLAYNDPQWLINRHGITWRALAMATMLSNLALQATRIEYETTSTQSSSQPTHEQTTH